MAQIDAKDRQTLLELQEKKQNVESQSQLVKQQIAQNQYTAQQSAITLKELESLPKETVTYESVGRAYFHIQLSDLQDKLKERIKLSNEKIQSLQQRASHLQKESSQIDSELNELVKQVNASNQVQSSSEGVKV